MKIIETLTVEIIEHEGVTYERCHGSWSIPLGDGSQMIPDDKEEALENLYQSMGLRTPPKAGKANVKFKPKDESRSGTPSPLNN